MILTDGKVRLRRYTAADIPLLCEAGQESIGDDFTPWMPWCHRDYNEADSSQYILGRDHAWENREEFAFGVFSEETGDYLGGVGLNQLSAVHVYANLGYWIRRSAWGRGYAVAAALLMARFGFQELHLGRVEIVIAVGNDKSCRVAEKAGALHEGVLRNRLRIAGKLHDAHMYSLVP